MTKTNRSTLELFGCYYFGPISIFFAISGFQKPQPQGCPTQNAQNSDLQHLHPKFPGKLKVTEKNGCDIWIKPKTDTQVLAIQLSDVCVNNQNFSHNFLVHHSDSRWVLER